MSTGAKSARGRRSSSAALFGAAVIVPLLGGDDAHARVVADNEGTSTAPADSGAPANAGPPAGNRPPPVPIRDPGPSELRPNPSSLPDPTPSRPARAQTPLREPGPNEVRPNPSVNRPPPTGPAAAPGAGGPKAEKRRPRAPLREPGPSEVRPNPSVNRPIATGPAAEREPAEPEGERPTRRAPLHDPGPHELRPDPSADRPAVGVSDPYNPIHDPGPSELRPDPAKPGREPYDSRELLPDANGSNPDVVSIGPGHPDLGDWKYFSYVPFPDEAGETTSVEIGCKGGIDSTRQVKRGCSAFPPKAERKHRAKPKANAGVIVGASTTLSAAQSEHFMTPVGPRTTLTLSTETVVKLGGELQLRHVGGDYKRIVDGNKISYQLTVSPKRAKQITDDLELAPILHDPRTIPVGDGLLIAEEEFTGSEGSGNVEGVLEVSGGQVSGKRQSAGVLRLDPDTVRITVGDDDFVRSVSKLGLGIDQLQIGLSNQGDESQGEATQVDLDISTDAGWDAYQLFLNTGRIPWRRKLEFATMDRDVYDGSQGTYLKLGPLEHSDTGDTFGTDTRVIRHSDGTDERLTTYYRNGATMRHSERSGSHPDEHTLLLEDVNRYLLDKYVDQVPDTDVLTDGETDDVRIDFKSAELWALRDQAIEWIQWQEKRSNDRVLTRDEVVEMARDGDTFTTGMSSPARVVVASNPEDILYELYASTKHMSDGALYYLSNNAGIQQLEYGNEDTMPGNAQVFDD